MSRGVRAVAAAVSMVLLVALAACTSSSGGGAPSSSSVGSSTVVPPSSSVSTPVATSTTPTHSSSFSGPPRPATSTLPNDVPTTGPNIVRGEKPPIMPLEATQHTTEGAKAFAAFFVKTIDWGYATTSSAYMRHYFLKSCVACLSTADALDQAQRLSHHFVGDRFSVKRIVGLPDDAGSVSIFFDVSAAEVVDAKNRFVNGYPALTEYREDLHLAWRSSRWLVQRMDPKG